MIVQSIRCIVEHELVPHPRLVHGRRAQAFDPRTQRYFGNRDTLAWLIHQKALGKKMPDKTRLRCDISIWLTHLRLPDKDNLMKTVFDALQVSGVITNDKWIRDGRTIVHDGVHKPAVAIHLTVVNGYPIDNLKIDL